MKHLDYIYFVGYSFLCYYVTEIHTFSVCPQPDVPANGKYVPKQNKFEPGDEVTYSCKKGFALSGKDRRICKSNGVWSDHTPFCDHSTNLSNPSVTNKGVRTSSVSRVVDGNTSSCFDWYNATGEYLYVHLDNKMVIRIVKVFLKKGIRQIQILTGLDNDMKLCADYKNFIETDRWITINCKTNVLADTVKILVTDKRFISVCEIEVYGKDEDSCEQPPMMMIPYGHFEVSRSKATLICEEGYKSEGNRLVCEGNVTWSGLRLRCDEILCDPILFAGQSGGEWIFPSATKKMSAGTRSELVCKKEYRLKGAPEIVICQLNGNWTQTNATCVEMNNSKPTTRAIIFGVVAVVIVIIIIGLLATTIHFIRKQRDKEVVVVYQTQGDDGSIPLSASEMEYSVPRYENLPISPKPPEPPSTPRPNFMRGTSSDWESNPSEQWKNTMKNRAVPPDITFGTMKASTIYGS